MELAEQKRSKFVIFVFALTLLVSFYVAYALIFNSIQPTTPDGGIRVMKTVLFNGFVSAIVFLLLLILNFIGYFLCKQKKMKGKSLSIIGIVLSIALNIYLLIGFFSGPR
jgi:hypothetical protein